LLRQALRVANTRDPKLSRDETKALLNCVMDVLKDDAIMDALPAKTGQRVYQSMGELLHDPDIFIAEKARSNEIAAAMYPRLLENVRSSDDPLKTAVNIAIVGNLIDFGTHLDYDLEQAIDDLHLHIDHFDDLRDDLQRAKTVLYIADNAGEIFFDKVLIMEILQQFAVNIVFSVRAGPILNDATMDDARLAGIDAITTIIEGTQSPGLLLDEASANFKAVYDDADIIIAKGQGNFESLSERPRSDNIYFMLKAKCDVMESYFHVPIGASILLHWNRS
jgi:damage-control phosphatase, subfamily I